MKRRRNYSQIFLLTLVTCASCGAQNQPQQIQITDGPIPVRVLVQGPSETDTDLQVICLFRSDPGNDLNGSLKEIDNKLKGLLSRIRNPLLFRGDLGETILIAPRSGTLTARKLMIIGLGDPGTFTPDRMELVGSIVYHEANRLGVAHPFFAPTILDGGVTKYPTGQVSEQVVRGILRALASEKVLKAAGDSTGIVIRDLTFLAGAKNANSTRDGIEKAFAATK